MAQISLTLPDGNSRQYDAGITAGEVAADISKSLGKKAISATVNGAHYDLAWPIEADRFNDGGGRFNFFLGYQN